MFGHVGMHHLHPERQIQQMRPEHQREVLHHPQRYERQTRPVQPDPHCDDWKPLNDIERHVVLRLKRQCERAIKKDIATFEPALTKNCQQGQYEAKVNIDFRYNYCTSTH